MTDNFQRDLGRVEGKLDSLIATVSADIAERKSQVADLQKRVGSLENRQYYFMGGGSVVSAVVAWVAAHIFR